MSTTSTTLRQQLRTLLILTNTEIQIAETRTAQARTEAVRRELTENAENGRLRAQAIEEAIRDLGGLPDVIRPIAGRLAASVKALAEQAQPLDEALLGDLALEHQLLDRSRYVKALATAENETTVVTLSEQLINAHESTVVWLTTLLAEEAIGGPVALRRGPLQAASGAALRAASIPATLTARGVDRAVDAIRNAPGQVSALFDRTEEAGEAALGRAAKAGQDALARTSRAGDTARKTASASRDAALEAAEQTARANGANDAADRLHAAREGTGTIDPADLPIDDYESLNVSSVVAAIKELEKPSDVRLVVAYEEAHKNRHGVVSAGQTRIAAIAQEVVGVK
ncbi:ferritin-like domain-containing protein [Williamsia sp. DF01-3]|uniref:ferritin-like domain-containing protein n=1 Tax=Williamsia sp. DF01-3 TaxID=2934157 RepID=UPI001FF4C056|nr:ferritin-like domain-containing protein [Williamsia sp. DF01-3]MCK0520524.1 ferritin-like domain-containing protein [Williamsia sp. DF01-3]